jgi:hypothetical protein
MGRYSQRIYCNLTFSHFLLFSPLNVAAFESGEVSRNVSAPFTFIHFYSFPPLHT